MTFNSLSTRPCPVLSCPRGYLAELSRVPHVMLIIYFINLSVGPAHPLVSELGKQFSFFFCEYALLHHLILLKPNIYTKLLANRKRPTDCGECQHFWARL